MAFRQTEANFMMITTANAFRQAQNVVRHSLLSATTIVISAALVAGLMMVGPMMTSTVRTSKFVQKKQCNSMHDAHCKQKWSWIENIPILSNLREEDRYSRGDNLEGRNTKNCRSAVIKEKKKITPLSSSSTNLFSHTNTSKSSNL